MLLAASGYWRLLAASGSWRLLAASGSWPSRGQWAGISTALMM